jgi:hypothetical protein
MQILHCVLNDTGGALTCNTSSGAARHFPLRYGFVRRVSYFLEPTLVLISCSVKTAFPSSPFRSGHSVFLRGEGFLWAFIALTQRDVARLRFHCFYKNDRGIRAPLSDNFRENKKCVPLLSGNASHNQKCYTISPSA